MVTDTLRNLAHRTHGYSVAAAWISGSLMVLFGCVPRAAFPCVDDDQCQADGLAGRCEFSGDCSLPSDGCPSGFRYIEEADPSLAGTCVAENSESSGTDGEQLPCTADIWYMDVSAADDSTQLSASENSSQYYGQRITAESSLVGAEVNTLSALLIRVADPPGDVTFAVVDEARQVKYRFGSYRAADIPVEPTFIQVANAEASYALQADDRVVVMYTDGDDTHKIRMHATADSFDAQRTHRIRWHVVDGWATGVDVDSSMRMGCTVE